MTENQIKIMIENLIQYNKILYQYEIDIRIRKIVNEINKLDNEFTKDCLHASLSCAIRDYEL